MEEESNELFWGLGGISEGALWRDFMKEVVFKQSLEVWVRLEQAATGGNVFMQIKY